MSKASIFAGLSAMLLASCGGPSGSKTPLNEEQFAEVKANCKLNDARLGASNYSESSTSDDGIPTTVTYEDDNPEAVSIFLTKKRSDGDMAQMILCVNQEFDRLGAEAKISLPEGHF